jgi:hypothetical protein
MRGGRRRWRISGSGRIRGFTVSRRDGNVLGVCVCFPGIAIRCPSFEDCAWLEASMCFGTEVEGRGYPLLPVSKPPPKRGPCRALDWQSVPQVPLTHSQTLRTKHSRSTTATSETPKPTWSRMNGRKRPHWVSHPERSFQPERLLLRSRRARDQRVLRRRKTSIGEHTRWRTGTASQVRRRWIGLLGRSTRSTWSVSHTEPEDWCIGRRSGAGVDRAKQLAALAAAQIAMCGGVGWGGAVSR